MNESSGRPVRLVGDVGGTNARFAILDDNGTPSQPSTLRVDDYSSLAEAIATYTNEHAIDRVDSAAIAVATPITGDQVTLTNNHWSFSIDETRARLTLTELHVVNDFTALALSVPHLPADQLARIGGGDSRQGATIAVIGPGTGLGVSGLVPCGDGWTALQGEGGHVTVGVSTERERAVRDLLAVRFRHVSAERFLSGPGLMNIATALRTIDGIELKTLTPADITRLGTSGEDAHCEETLTIFCRLLGSCAGNLALTIGAEGGVYIGGGVVPRLGDFFERSDFRQAFEAKGRMHDYLARIPTHVIHSPYPALIGAARLLLA